MKAPTSLEVEFDAQLEAVTQARHQFTRWLKSRRVPTEIAEEFALVVTELVTNAVEASPSPASRIEVEACLQDHQVVLKVRDQGLGFASPVGGPALPGRNEARGRGLPIVNALMDGFSVRRSGDFTEVEVTRGLPHGEGSTRTTAAPGRAQQNDD